MTLPTAVPEEAPDETVPVPWGRIVVTIVAVWWLITVPLGIAGGLLYLNASDESRSWLLWLLAFNDLPGFIVALTFGARRFGLHGVRALVTAAILTIIGYTLWSAVIGALTLAVSAVLAAGWPISADFMRGSTIFFYVSCVLGFTIFVRSGRRRPERPRVVRPDWMLEPEPLDRSEAAAEAGRD